MNVIEKFFKNRISFTPNSDQPIPDVYSYISKNVFKDYSIDFLKEKVKPFCCYLYSNLDQKNGNWHTIEILLSSIMNIPSCLYGLKK